MLTRIRQGLILALLLSAALLATGNSSAKSGGYRYFPETGHWVTGEFLVAYESIPDPVRIYGYPITDAFQNQTTKRMVQYFQRAHFELHLEQTGEQKVALTPLGEYLYRPGQQIPMAPNLPGCRNFSETNHQVCYAFLDFFDDNGGTFQFGYPQSDIEVHNERLVQFFQRAAFEWHPEMQPGSRVVLSDLGRQYFEVRNEDQARLPPNRDSRIPQAILGLKVQAFVGKAVMPPSGRQTLYVVVQDQNQFPVQNAQVTFMVRKPSGLESRYIMPLTDPNGVTRQYFVIDQQASGRAEVIVTATYEKFQQQTKSSFRIWY